jgi:hypothetical protein
MKSVFFALLFISLSFITVSAQQHSSDPASSGGSAGWINIAPDNAGFRVLMPGKATEKIDPVEGSPGVENHIFTLETPAAGYVVSYVQFPQNITQVSAIKGMLDAGRDGALASTGAKLTSEKEIRLNEHYGREWLLELPAGMTATNHAYWVKSRLYQLVFIIAPSANDTSETVRARQELAYTFFSSFKLISEGGTEK